tara:strand:+ start:14090 stop:14392 length:303 start_codon:yes stop_codon:yes gene_type:complete
MVLLDFGKIVNCITDGCTKKDRFSGGMTGSGTGSALGGLGAILLFSVIMIILVLLFAKYLWNVCLVPLVPVKKCDSVWHLVGASILFGLLFPSSPAANSQ